uniref:tyrosine-type recombinase/integrase n=1 Tax=Pedobacter schmidteae TaxID=2201271 RepID=UPI000EB1BD14|nr:site-specific integrase [Pedobacter schmidteae]
MQNKYTTPALKQGKVPTSLPKGTTKNMALLENNWYVEYYFNGKRFRITDNLNNIKNYNERKYKFDVLIESLKDRLANGYNPINPEEYLVKIAKETISLKDAITKFTDYHTLHQSRKSTIATYKSKLNHLLEFTGNIQLTELTTRHLENFILSKVDNKEYSQKSVSLAKRTFSAFYNVLIDSGYDLKNPVSTINKKIKSFKETRETHLPYSDKQLKDVMQYLDDNDTYTALFARFIYYTCVRPSEIRGLLVRDIDLNKRTITIRAAVKKVTKFIKDDVISIPIEFIPCLEQLNLEQQPKENYIMGSTTKFINETPIRKNTPLERLNKALKVFKLDGKGYDLYSFKHTSNINRWKTGKWNLDQIMVANRHTNIQQTLTYLRDLNKETEIKDLPVPTI